MKFIEKKMIMKRPEKRTGVYCYIFNTPEEKGRMKFLWKQQTVGF